LQFVNQKKKKNIPNVTGGATSGTGALNV